DEHTAGAESADFVRKAVDGADAEDDALCRVVVHKRAHRSLPLYGLFRFFRQRPQFPDRPRYTSSPARTARSAVAARAPAWRAFAILTIPTRVRGLSPRPTP